MKKLLWFFSISSLVIVFSAPSLFAQWTAQTSGTTQALYSVKAVNDNVVWAGGSTGVVVRTIDGGTTWAPVTSPNTALRVYSLDAVDANTAWAYTTNPSTGVDSKIYKTTDGGTTWTEQFANANNFGNAIKFADANFGVAYGDPEPWPPAVDWEIVITTNGGTNWTRVPNTAYPPADSAFGEYGAVGALAISGDNIWFGTSNTAGALPFQGKVYRSTDRGTTWTVAPIGSSVVSVSGIDFKNGSVGVAASYEGDAARTTDGGLTWTAQSLGTTLFLSVASVPGTDKFFAVGSGGVAQLSNDNGTTWAATTTGVTGTLRSVDATNANAWVVGNTGVILKWSGPALPVELTSFAATAVGKKVELKWSTATEINNKGFEIERKNNGDNSSWITVGFKEGNGTSTESKNYSFTDDLSSQKDATFSYRLKQVDFDGTFEYSQEVNVEVNSLPTVYALNQNYPNPFNPTTKISYALPYESNVKVTVFTALGEQVTELVNSVQEPGYYEFNFDANNFSSGLYFYNIEASAVDGSDQFKAIKKMMLVR